jgi:acyl-coenzyme A thioesterase PaaI-like protein
VIARCECYEIAGSIAYVRGFAYDTDPGDPACHVTGSYMLLEGAPLI